MKLVKYFIEYEGILIINKEYTASVFPLCIEWFQGCDLILEPSGFQKISITDQIFVLRKEIPKKGKTDVIPFLFLESVRRKDYERARKYLSFNISDKNIKDFFGEFEILVNNYLDHADTFSILPKDNDIAKSFIFEINDGKIANISPL